MWVQLNNKIYGLIKIVKGDSDSWKTQFLVGQTELKRVIDGIIRATNQSGWGGFS